LLLGLELLRLQVRGGRQAPGRLPLHREPGRAQEDVPRAGALVPGGGLPRGLQQRATALLDEAERAGLDALVVVGATVRGHLAGLNCSDWGGSEAPLLPQPPPPPSDTVEMILYGVRRLALAVPLLLGMSVLIFALMRLVPGDPAVTVLGYKANPEGGAALRHAL